MSGSKSLVTCAGYHFGMHSTRVEALIESCSSHVVLSHEPMHRLHFSTFYFFLLLSSRYFSTIFWWKRRPFRVTHVNTCTIGMWYRSLYVQCVHHFCALSTHENGMKKINGNINDDSCSFYCLRTIRHRCIRHKYQWINVCALSAMIGFQDGEDSFSLKDESEGE